MTARATLQNISNQSGKAAEIYPEFIKLMDRAGVPPESRAAVTMYLSFAIGTDGMEGLDHESQRIN